MKRKGIIIFLLLTLVINYSNAEIIKEKNEKLIIQSFKETNSKFKSFNISYNGKVNNQFMNQDELENISKDILESMEFKEDYREVVTETQMTKISIYGQVKEDENITLIMYSYLDKDNNDSETTIFIDINENKDYKRTEEIASKVSQILEKQNIKAEITSCIVGAYDGRLEDKHKKEIIKNLINITQSKEVESLVNEDISSYSLYSKNIDNYIYSGRNKINLNIAIRYDEYRNQTYLFIASPIITMGY